MTSASMITTDSNIQPAPLISREGWISIGVLGGLFVFLHGNFLLRTWRIAMSDNNWSHSLIVPLIAGYYIYQNRQRLMDVPRRVNWIGLVFVFIGLLGYAFWIYPGRNDMFQGYSMILGLLGVVLFLLGWPMMKVLWFPIAYLAFGVKVSQRLWDEVAVQLQWVAAHSATAVLKFFTIFMNFDVSNHGSTIDITQYPKVLVNGIPMMQPVTNGLNVAEACAGLRMLMAFLALGVALAFLWERANWQRLIMALMAVPIAVAINVGRVTVLGLLSLYNPELTKGDFHIFIGMVMLIPAAGLFLLLGWVLDRLVITEHGRKSQSSAPPISRTPQCVASAFDKVASAKGVAAGVVITLLIGLGYALIWATARPDLFSQHLTPAMVYAMLGVCAVVLLVVLFYLPRLMPVATGSHQSGRWRGAAMGLIAGVLVTATIGQSAVITVTKTILHKQAVPLHDPLFYMHNKLGTWELQTEAPRLSAEVQSELGTDKYFTRACKDTSWPAGTAGQFITVHVAYYTGTADTVPHVAERCLVAGGATALDKSTITLSIDNPDFFTEDGQITVYSQTTLSKVHLPDTQIPATSFVFTHRENPNHKSNVVYFFAANGKFLPNPDSVRFQGFDPRDKYAYYCKIEMRVHGVGDSEIATERAESLLSVLLPEIMACLPDWKDVTEGRWPAPPSE
jgi:exosortase